MPFLSLVMTDLWKQEAGGTFLEFALIGALVLIFSMLLLLAWSKSA